MSYGVVRVQKMGSGGVKGIEIHDRREKKGISHTNKDIDWSKTHLNYDLHQEQNHNFNQAVKNRINELNLPKAVRKDAVVMSQVLVTSDHDFFKDLSKGQQEQFFKDSYNFLAERYGKENVISATVHLDEHTPHMHFNFVPVTDDGRLSAKSVLTRGRLIGQQDKFHEQVGKKYGLERGTRGGKAKHLEVAEYKLQTTLGNIEHAENEINALETQFQGLQAIKKSQQELSKIGVKKLFSKNLSVNPDELQNLKNLALYAPLQELINSRQKEEIKILEKKQEPIRLKNIEIDKLKQQVKDLKTEKEKVLNLGNRCEQLQQNLNWYKDFYDDLVLNVMERVSEKGVKWLKETVLPKWAVDEIEKDIDKNLEKILYPKKIIDLELDR